MKQSNRNIFLIIIWWLVFILLVSFLLNKPKNNYENKGEKNTGQIENLSQWEELKWGNNGGEEENIENEEQVSYIYEKNEEIGDIDDTNIDGALKYALKNFEDNNWENLADYEQLMYIYLDKQEYEKLMELWWEALVYIEKNNVKEYDEWVITSIYSLMIQSSLYTWDIEKAKTLSQELTGDKFYLEEVMLQYKLGNHDYLVENHENIRNDKYYDVWIGLFLIAKSYLKRWEEMKALDVLIELFDYWKNLEDKDTLVATYYWYIASLKLKEIYTERWDLNQANLYDKEFLIYKSRIDKEEKIAFSESGRDLNYNKDLMYDNIQRILNF